jgi:hypothetical protein
MKRTRETALVSEIEDRYRDPKRAQPHNINELKATLMTLGNGLYRAESKIKGAGQGLYCTRDIKAGELITWYSGARLTYEQSKAKELDRSYFYALDKMRSVMAGNYYRDENGVLQHLDTSDALERHFRLDGTCAFMVTM